MAYAILYRLLEVGISAQIFAMVASSCGGVLNALPNSAIAELKSGSRISSHQVVKVSFLNQIDERTMEGNITTIQDGMRVPNGGIRLEDGGYTILIQATEQGWIKGKELIVEIQGGADGLKFLRGVPLQTFRVHYFVEDGL